MKAGWIWGIAALATALASGCGSVADDADAGPTIDAPDNGIDASGEIPDAAPEADAPFECTSNFDCDDEKRCTTDTCTVSRQCSNEPLDGVAVPGAIQPPGDCKLLACEDGEEVMIIDDGDLPIDGLECTRDECNSGEPSNPPEDEGTDCSAGTCDGEGNCTGCSTGSDCGTDTFCRQFTCAGGTCGVSDADDGTPLPSGSQVDGDCRLLVCNGAGGTREIEDDSDPPPDDGNDCTFETCFMGAPLHPPKGVGQPCTGGFCDGDGACVECTMDSHCDGFGAGICEIDVCNGGNCDVEQETSGTPAPEEVQTPFDCQLMVCDGFGGVEATIDDTDLPFDGRECTDDVCSGGTASNPPKPRGTACTEFGGKACNGAGDCVECTMDGHCDADEVCSSSDVCLCLSGCTGIVCGSTTCSDEVPFCCGTGPTATCAIEHFDGLGAKWFDCRAVGTYDVEQAFAACTAHYDGDSSPCFTSPGMCGGGSSRDAGVPTSDAGTGDGDAVCGSTGGFDCTCWIYTGTLTGYVFDSPSSACGCPDPTFDPMWY